MQSHIPDIGSEVKVPASEVTAAVRSHEVANFGRPRELIIILLLGGLHYWAAERARGGLSL